MAYIRLKLAGFRWYGGCALAGIILLVCVLQFTGLCIGGNAYERRVLPTEKSCISSCGGHLLIGYQITSGILIMVQS